MKNHPGKMLLLLSALLLMCSAAPATAQETPQALFLKAEALFKEKKHAEALALYQKAIAADGSLSQTYRGAVLCYGALGNPQGALKYMDSLFLDRQDSAELEYGMGCALYGLQKYEDSAKYFDKAIKMKPDLAAAWNNRGSIYHFVARDYARARQYYEKAIEAGTRTGNAAVVSIAKENMANLPREEDLKPMSLEDFLNAFIARADESDAAGIRWLVQGQKANCDPAMDWLLDQSLQASASSPDTEKTTVALATLLAAEYSGVHKSDSLKKKLAAYTGLSPDRKKKLLEAGRMLTLGMEQEQQSSFAQAARSYGSAAGAYAAAGETAKKGLAMLYLGDAQRREKKYAEARSSYADAEAAFAEVKDDRQRALALTSLGLASAMLKDHDQALDYLNRALKLYTGLKDDQSAQKVRENIARLEQMKKN